MIKHRKYNLSTFKVLSLLKISAKNIYQGGKSMVKHPLYYYFVLYYYCQMPDWNIEMSGLKSLEMAIKSR